jgi:putative transposase
MDVSMMSRMKELEKENRRMKKLFRRLSKKSGEAISQKGDGEDSAHKSGCLHTGCLPHISESCFCYDRKLDAQNGEVANWLIRLTDHHRNWGFSLCYLYLRNVKGFKWNRKRV